MRLGLVLVLVLAVCVLVGGCSDDDAGAPPATGAVTDGSGAGEPVRGEDESAGVVLSQFVDAAGAGDAQTMWDLLSEGTRERFGPTFEAFETGTAAALSEGVGSFAGTPYEVVLARRIDAEWGVAAISGERQVEGTEEVGAYATALRAGDGGTWRLAIGALPLVPPQTDLEGWLADHEDVLLWVNGEPVASGATPATEPGDVLVAFVREEDEAAAVAWVAG